MHIINDILKIPVFR